MSQRLAHPFWLGFCESGHAARLLESIEFAHAVHAQSFETTLADFLRLCREALLEKKYELFGLRLSHVMQLAGRGVAVVSRAENEPKG